MSAPSRDNSRSGVSRFLQWTGIVVGVLILLIVATAVLLPFVYPPEQVKKFIVPRVEAALERDFEVESARVRIFPWPSLRLRNYQVANAEGFGAEPAIEGETLDLNLQFWPLIRGEVEIDNIELTEPFVRYEVNEEGVSNLAGIGGTAEDEEAAPLAITVSDFSAYSADISYTNRQSNQKMHLNLDFRANAVPDADTGTLASQGSMHIHSMESQAIDTPKEEPLTLEDMQLEYAVVAHMQDDRLTVDRFAFMSESFLLEASGIIEHLSTEPTLDLQIANEGTSLSGLTKLMGTDPTGTALEGEASFDLQITGPIGTPDQLNVHGLVGLSDVAYTLETFNEPLRIPQAELNFGGQVMTLDETLMYLGENELEMSFHLNNLFAPLAGEGAAPALPRAEFQLTSDRLDLTGLYAETDPDEPGYFDLVQARLANTEITGRDPGVIAEEFYGDMSLPPAEATGDVEIGEFINPPYRIDNLSFQVAVNPRRMAVEDISGQMYGGTISGAVAVDLGENASPYPAEYQFSLQDGNAGQFMEDWTSLGSVVTGTIDYTIDGSTRFDTALLPVTEATNADGEAVVTEGGFRNLALVEAIIDRLGINADALMSFDRLGGPYEIQEGRFLVDDWELSTGQLDGEVDGNFGFGGDVDLELGLAMPVAMVQNSRLVEMIGGNIGGLLGRIAGEDEMVDVAMDIGGTMSNPRIKVNTDALENVLRSLIRDAGGRIPDLLDRLR